MTFTPYPSGVRATPEEQEWLMEQESNWASAHWDVEPGSERYMAFVRKLIQDFAEKKMREQAAPSGALRHPAAPGGMSRHVAMPSLPSLSMPRMPDFTAQLMQALGD